MENQPGKAGGSPALIPRYQAIIFSVLVIASIAMGAVLWHMHEKSHEQMVQGLDSAPTKAPAIAAEQQATLLVANDDDNGLREQIYSLPLPSADTGRARAVLSKLLDIYAAPDSTHPVPGGAASVKEVFLLPIASTAKTTSSEAPELAVVDLAGSFPTTHPSGLETETLTVLSIIGTLHANLPRVTQVRFLVDGEPHPTLAGHADLTRTYLVSDAVQATSNVANQ